MAAVTSLVTVSLQPPLLHTHAPSVSPSPLPPLSHSIRSGCREEWWASIMGPTLVMREI